MMTKADRTSRKPAARGLDRPAVVVVAVTPAFRVVLIGVRPLRPSASHRTDLVFPAALPGGHRAAGRPWERPVAGRNEESRKKGRGRKPWGVSNVCRECEKIRVMPIKSAS